MAGIRQPIAFMATAHPHEALHFYRDILRLELLEETPFALVFSDAGQMLRLQKVEEHVPAAHTVHGWAVADIDLQIEEFVSKGIAFLRFARLNQSELGVWTSPDGHRVAWFKDPSGNNLSLTQFATGETG